MTTASSTRGRVSKAELDVRVNEVALMILQGLSREKIIEYGETKNWNVTFSQVDRYIARARKKFEAQAKIKIEFEMGRALSRLDDLYARSMAIQDYKTALQIVKERATLTGLYSVANNIVGEDTSQKKHQEFMAAVKAWKDVHPETQ